MNDLQKWVECLIQLVKDCDKEENLNQFKLILSVYKKCCEV